MCSNEPELLKWAHWSENFCLPPLLLLEWASLCSNEQLDAASFWLCFSSCLVRATSISCLVSFKVCFHLLVKHHLPNINTSLIVSNTNSLPFDTSTKSFSKLQARACLLKWSNSSSLLRVWTLALTQIIALVN